MTIIPIAPYTMGSPAAPKVGTQFEVRYVQYTSPTAVADCHLLDAEGVEIMPVGLVPATAEQCAAWTDDAAFAAVLAVNAGFELVSEE
jgi:hypothetical protein